MVKVGETFDINVPLDFKFSDPSSHPVLDQLGTWQVEFSGHTLTPNPQPVSYFADVIVVDEVEGEKKITLTVDPSVIPIGGDANVIFCTDVPLNVIEIVVEPSTGNFASKTYDPYLHLDPFDCPPSPHEIAGYWSATSS
jgi:hypothetical protein